MQKNRFEILCTGQLDPTLVEKAAEHALDVDLVPFIKMKLIEDPRLKTEIALLSTESRTVIFTSANAVNAVANDLQDKKPGWKLYCVGEATRNAAAELFGTGAVVASASYSSKLAKIISDDYAGGEIIFFCGNIRREDIPDHFSKNNIPLKELVVYETIPNPVSIEKKYDGILFFSPSEVKSFFSKNKPGMETILFAIGETTAGEIKKLSSNPLVVGTAPGKQELLGRAIEFFHSDLKSINRSQATKHE